MAIYDGITKVAGGVAPMITLTKAQYDALTTAERVGNIYMVTDEFETNIFNLMYPVGSIYMTVNSANPSTLFGGTWVAWGAGRVPVGVNVAQSEFDTLEKMGGSLQHAHGALNTQNGTLAAAVGSTDSNANTIGFLASNDNNVGIGGTPTYKGTITMASGGFFSHWTKIFGATSSASSMPQYITCYMWKRTS